jgi:hypothetical protein
MLWSIVSLAHFIGLTAVGAATVKSILLLRTRSNPSLIPAYLQIRRTVTFPIVIGYHLLLVSGVAWLLMGYELTTILIVKLVLVLGSGVFGSLIARKAEPRFIEQAPAAGEAPSPEFLRIQEQYVLLEGIATGLFYLVIIVWVLR